MKLPPVVVALICLAAVANAQNRNDPPKQPHHSQNPRVKATDVIDKSIDAEHFFMDIHTGVFSRYVSDGQRVSEGFVFQPTVALGYKNVTFEFWGNMDIEDEFAGEFTETNYTFDYSWDPYEKITLSHGITLLDFPALDDPATWEAYTAVAFDTMLDPTLTYIFDIDEIGGWYVTFSLEHEFEKAIPITDNIAAGILLGSEVQLGSSRWAESLYGVDKTALVSLDLQLAFPISLSERFALMPTVYHTSVLDDELRAANEDENDFFWYGISFQASL